MSQRKRLFSLTLLALAVSCKFCSPLLAQQQPEAKRQVAIQRGLDYLANAQHRLGYWSTGSPQDYRVAMTALAANAMLCEGSTANRGKYAKHLRKAIDYLVSQSRTNGMIGSPRDSRYTYGHGFSMLCLAQLLGEEEDSDRREELQAVLMKAVEFTSRAQTSRGGWGYVSARDGNDYDEMSTVVTQLQGLLACRNAGIPVPRKTIQQGIEYLFTCQNTDGGVKYNSRLAGGSRPPISAGALIALQGLRPLPARQTGDKQKERLLKILILAGGPTRDYRLACRLLRRQADCRTSVLLQSIPVNKVAECSQETDQLLSEFPTAEQLNQFDVVIAFDPDWRQFEKEQIDSLDQWIRKGGGGLILQAGDCNTPDVARRKDRFTVVKGWYPVRLAPTLLIYQFAPASNKDWRLSWTADGKSSALFTAVGGGGPAERVWDNLPIFRCQPTLGPAEDSQILARLPGPKLPKDLGEPIAMASRQIDKGKVIYIGTPETWRLAKLDQDEFARFWLTALRSTRRRILADADRPETPPEPDAKATDDDERYAERLGKMRRYCERALLNVAGSNTSGHWHYAHLYFAQTQLQQDREPRQRYFEAITAEIMKRQQANGSWTDSGIGPVYVTAINTAILQFPDCGLPFYSR